MCVCVVFLCLCVYVCVYVWVNKHIREGMVCLVRVGGECGGDKVRGEAEMCSFPYHDQLFRV